MSILVCDDHPLVRSALALAAEAACGEPPLVARDFTEAWATAAATPDLALCVVDLHMPGAGPVEGLTGLKARAPGARILVVTGSELDEDLLASLDLGVDGFLPKTAESGVIDAALKLVLAGGRYLPPRVAALATGRPPVEAPEPRGPIETAYGRLGSRQRDILEQMADGRSNKEIARTLGLSPATVKTHVAQVIAVLGATNRTEAAAKARAQGLI
jgi:two-component system nitrate/nitrite response regulator NarL